MREEGRGKREERKKGISISTRLPMITFLYEFIHSSIPLASQPAQYTTTD